MLIAVTGIGIITDAMSSVTSFAVDGELRALWRRRTMQSHLNSLRDHYLIAGWGTPAPAIARELRRTGRELVAILPADALNAAAAAARDGAETIVTGDPSDDERLLEAGIEQAIGVFADPWAKCRPLSDEAHWCSRSGAERNGSSIPPPTRSCAPARSSC